MKNITITYYGHSCFEVKADDYSIVLDPYDNNVRGYKELKLTTNEVLCSHGHGDHSYKEACEIIKKDNNPFTIKEIHSFHDDQNGSLRGENTIRILECDGIRISHFGDIGCIPTKEQIELLKNLDVALIPVGGYYTMEADKVVELLNEIKPKLVIPMHYRLNDLGFEVIGELKDFTKYFSNVNYSDSNSLVVDGKGNGITVLTYIK